MQPLPHSYVVHASGESTGDIALAGEELPALAADAPPEFDGPGGRWSPESLLCAAVAGCFILTFRAMARASKLEWRELSCTVDGTLERVAGVSQFTRFVTRATLTPAAGADHGLCRRLLEKAEKGCLVANSLRSERSLQIEIRL